MQWKEKDLYYDAHESSLYELGRVTYPFGSLVSPFLKGDL